MAHIDYFFATNSPYTYLAGLRMEEIAAKHGATITYKPLDIIALFARTGGTPPGERHESRKELRLQELRRQSRKTGLPLDLDTANMNVNPAPSSYAFISASKAGGGDLGKLVHAITGKRWAEGADIAQDDVIRAALEEAGFDPALADSGMLAGAEEYANNLEDAVSAGVFGAPFYIVDGSEKFWGQDRIDDLDLFLSGKL